MRRLRSRQRRFFARPRRGRRFGRRSMPCLKKRLILVLATLSLSSGSCAQLGLPDPFRPERVSTDSYCQVYNQVIVEKGDGTIVAKVGVKKRILANEQT